MLWQEWWCFEIATLLSGYLPNPDTTVAIFTISMTADTLLFNFCMGKCGQCGMQNNQDSSNFKEFAPGLGVAACALVGGLLGEGKVYEAKVMAFMAHVVNACLWVLLAGVLLAPPVRSRFAQSLIGSGYDIVERPYVFTYF